MSILKLLLCAACIALCAIAPTSAFVGLSILKLHPHSSSRFVTSSCGLQMNLSPNTGKLPRGKSAFAVNQVVTVLKIFATSTVIRPIIANAAQNYLIEPTDDFKDELKKVEALNSVRTNRRQEWDKTVDKFLATEDSDVLEKSLESLTAFMKKYEDVPPGVKKTELVKICRSKKFLPTSTKRRPRTFPYWTTKVEIAYQDLIREFNKKMNPDSKVGGELLF